MHVITHDFSPQPKSALRLTDWLRASLVKENVSNGVINALEAALKAMRNSNNPSAIAYAGSMDRAYSEYQLHGLKHQVVYLMLNVSDWRGEEAAAVKKVLRKWSAE